MLNNTDNITLSLKKIGLRPDECKVYLSLLDSPKSHLELARKTGVNRTKVYRIADELIKRGLVTVEQDDLGKRLAANSPDNLEIALTTAEEKLLAQRQLLDNIMPDLRNMFSTQGTPKDNDFIVNTYEGVDGFKQMLWNELKTKGEILIYGDGTIQDLIDDERWAEKHRSKTLEQKYTIREILNPGGKPANFTKNQEFIKKAFNRREIPADVLPLAHQMAIYNDTVAVYNWRDGKKVGFEVINPAFAAMQRAIFESYWRLAK